MTDIILPDHLSYSQVDTYLTCGERYRLQKIAKAPSLPMWAGVGGSAVHAVTEARDLAKFGLESNGPTDFLEVFDLAILEEQERTGFDKGEWTVTGRGKETEAWWRTKGPAFCAYWDTWVSKSSWQIWLTPDDQPAIELELHPTFGGFPDVLYIDRVMVTSDGELVVLDLKTGSRTPRLTQLGDYATGMEQCLGIRPTYGTFWMARKGFNTTPANLDHYTQATVDLRYSRVREGIERGSFVPHESSLCDSCPVRDFCYAVNGKNSSLYSPFAVDTL